MYPLWKAYGEIWLEPSAGHQQFLFIALWTGTPHNAIIYVHCVFYKYKL